MPVNGCRIWVKAGAGERTRTADLLITNQLLYQLSYAGNPLKSVTCEDLIFSASRSCQPNGVQQLAQRRPWWRRGEPVRVLILTVTMSLL